MRPIDKPRGLSIGRIESGWYLVCVGAEERAPTVDGGKIENSCLHHMTTLTTLTLT
jgi:hypothetical protein